MSGYPAVAMIVLDDDAAAGANGFQQLVSYCDACRRWGERGTEHVCGVNWSEHLLPVLATLVRRTS